MADLTEFSLPEAIADLARTPATCAVARVAQHLRAPQRRKRYLEHVRHRGPLDLGGAHGLDAAGADHAGVW